jgi:TRAP-type uncharacterized transport system substrate-binding protein
MAAALTLLPLAHAACATPLLPQAQEARAAPAQPQVAPAPVDAVPPPPQRRVVVHNGMVRYDKPIFHNGHRVLWHGAWRDGAAPGESAAAKPAASAKPQDFLILADRADASATRMAAELAPAMETSGQHVKAVSGDASPAALDKAVSGDSADLAIVATDSLVDSHKSQTDAGAVDWRARAPYLARLASEPIALIARRSVADIHELAGRKVNVDTAGSANAASAAIVFSRLNIAPDMTNEPLLVALASLARGEIDAIFVVGGNDSRALADFGKDGRFHILAIPYAPALQALYCPMRLTARDQPSFIGVDEKIDTIGVMTALVAIDAPPDSPRASRLAPLANLLFEKFDHFFGASNNLNWKGVNLAAQIAGWPRFGATQAWLNENKGAPNAALETFRTMAQTAAAASEGPSGADADRLYESLMQWSGTAN